MQSQYVCEMRQGCAVLGKQNMSTWDWPKPPAQGQLKVMSKGTKVEKAAASATMFRAGRRT